MARILPIRNAILILAIALASPQVGEADIDISSGFWSATYNCPDQKEGDATWLTCDGLKAYGNWIASTGQVEQITPLANMAAGGGGSGQRHWIGSGKNNNSGSAQFCLTAPQPEFWFRYYTRWQQGYFMSGQQAQKLIYGVGGGPYIDTNGGDGIRVVLNGNVVAMSTAGVWNTIMGGQVSNGKWHEFQFHLKAAGANGGGDVWVDGKHVLSFTGYDWGSIKGWQCVIYPENVESNATGTTMYQDIDDVAISTKGYITSLIPGGATGSAASPPSAPTNLRVQ